MIDAPDVLDEVEVTASRLRPGADPALLVLLVWALALWLAVRR